MFSSIPVINWISLLSIVRQQSDVVFLGKDTEPLLKFLAGIQIHDLRIKILLLY